MRRRLFALSILAVLGIAGDVLLCRDLQRQMVGQLGTWAQNLRDQGFTVSYGKLHARFLPWGATVVVPDLSVGGGKAMVPGGIYWHAERIALSLSLFRPDVLTVAPAGEQTLRAATGPGIVFFAEALNAEVPIGEGRPDQIDIDAESLVGGLRQSPQHQDVRIGELSLTLHAARGGAARTSARLSVSMHGLGLPDDGRWPLGATINQLDADLSLASPALSGDAPIEQARAWRDWGGVLTVQSLLLHWGPLDLRGAAELGLDSKLQPAGRGSARVAGSSATLDALARAGTITSGIAQTAKAVLALMARPAQADQAGDAVELPFTLQDSTLSVGKIPLMRLGSVGWGK